MELFVAAEHNLRLLELPAWLLHTAAWLPVVLVSQKPVRHLARCLPGNHRLLSFCTGPRLQPIPFLPPKAYG